MCLCCGERVKRRGANRGEERGSKRWRARVEGGYVSARKSHHESPSARVPERGDCSRCQESPIKGK